MNFVHKGRHIFNRRVLVDTMTEIKNMPSRADIPERVQHCPNAFAHSSFICKQNSWIHIALQCHLVASELSCLPKADGPVNAQGIRTRASQLRGTDLETGLATALADAVRGLPIPRVMSYQLADGETTVEFVRPVRHLVALYGSQVLPLKFLGLDAGRETSGHRFMSDAPVQIESAECYEETLRKAHVLVSYEERRAELNKLLSAKAAELHGTAIIPADLLDEVTALTEWPVVYTSSFEEDFLGVPEECLILTMQLNQKYFPLRDSNGKLMNKFLLVSQLIANDGGKEISAGNARVVRARLADAKFFYETDMKETLESRVPRTVRMLVLFLLAVSFLSLFFRLVPQAAEERADTLGFLFRQPEGALLAAGCDLLVAVRLPVRGCLFQSLLQRALRSRLCVGRVLVALVPAAVVMLLVGVLGSRGILLFA